MLIESSSKNFDIPVNVIRFTSPANTRTADIERNTDYKLQHKYVVGENKLQVYVDDILLCLGTEFNEVGIKGEESDIIQFVDWDVGKERNLEYIIIGKDYLTLSVNGEKVAKVDNNIDLSVPTKTSDLINNSGFVTGSGRVANADSADKVVGTLTIQKNGTTIKTYDGSANITANISVPTALTDLSGLEKLVSSGDDSIQDIRIISQASYNALNTSSIANGTVYLVY
jgi:hypothetical protein